MPQSFMHILSTLYVYCIHINIIHPNWSKGILSIRSVSFKVSFAQHKLTKASRFWVKSLIVFVNRSNYLAFKKDFHELMTDSLFYWWYTWRVVRPYHFVLNPCFQYTCDEIICTPVVPFYPNGHVRYTNDDNCFCPNKLCQPFPDIRRILRYFGFSTQSISSVYTNLHLQRSYSMPI